MGNLQTREMLRIGSSRLWNVIHHNHTTADMMCWTRKGKGWEIQDFYNNSTFSQRPILFCTWRRCPNSNLGTVMSRAVLKFHETRDLVWEVLLQLSEPLRTRFPSMLLATGLEPFPSLSLAGYVVQAEFLRKEQTQIGSANITPASGCPGQASLGFFGKDCAAPKGGRQPVYDLRLQQASNGQRAAGWA